MCWLAESGITGISAYLGSEAVPLSGGSYKGAAGRLP